MISGFIYELIINHFVIHYNYRDQVISHFYICEAEPSICPINCGQVLLPPQEPIESHFRKNTARHLDDIFSKLMRMREDKVLEVKLINEKKYVYITSSLILTNLGKHFQGVERY